MVKLKVGMIGGGGPDSFFGMVHNRAIALDASRELVAGALRSIQRRRWVRPTTMASKVIPPIRRC